MAKTYTKEEVIELLQKKYKNGEVYQTDCDYEDEYHISFWENDRVVNLKTVKVVSTMTAITNQEDFEADKNKFLKDVIEALLNEEELVQIGDYNKLAEDLFWREY